jgi:hypothetical protein
LYNRREFSVVSLPRNGSERNSKSFLYRGTTGIPPEQTYCSVYSVFRGIIFLSEIANPIVEGYGKWLEGKNISLVMREEL